MGGKRNEANNLLLLQQARRACVPIQRLERQLRYPQLLFYTFREALRRFRKEFGLEHKPIKLVDLYKKPIGSNQPEKRDFREHV